MEWICDDIYYIRFGCGGRWDICYFRWYNNLLLISDESISCKNCWGCAVLPYRTSKVVNNRNNRWMGEWWYEKCYYCFLFCFKLHHIDRYVYIHSYITLTIDIQHVCKRNNNFGTQMSKILNFKDECTNTLLLYFGRFWIIFYFSKLDFQIAFTQRQTIKTIKKWLYIIYNNKQKWKNTEWLRFLQNCNVSGWTRIHMNNLKDTGSNAFLLHTTASQTTVQTTYKTDSHGSTSSRTLSFPSTLMFMLKPSNNVTITI